MIKFSEISFIYILFLNAKKNRKKQNQRHSFFYLYYQPTKQAQQWFNNQYIKKKLGDIQAICMVVESATMPIVGDKKQKLKKNEIRRRRSRSGSRKRNRNRRRGRTKAERSVALEVSSDLLNSKNRSIQVYKFKEKHFSLCYSLLSSLFSHYAIFARNFQLVVVMFTLFYIN